MLKINRGDLGILNVDALAAKGEIIIVGSGAMRGSGIIQGEWYLVNERKRGR